MSPSAWSAIAPAQGLNLSDTAVMNDMSTSRPSEALHIDALPMPQAGTLGLVHCPGRQGVDGSGQVWRRDLSADLRAIKAWGALTVLTLVGEHELSRLGVPQLPQVVRDHGLAWAHVPIPDFEPPNEASMTAWSKHMPGVLSSLARQEKVVVHCAAGLGRTGTVAAMLLVLQGLAGEEAIARVRTARPGTIETRAQEDFVRQFSARVALA